MAPPLCHGVDQTYPIIRLAYIRLRQFVALVPLSHRATTVQRPISWPVSKFWTPVELLRVVQILDNFPARVRTLTNLNIQLSQVGTTPARIVLQNTAPPGARLIHLQAMRVDIHAAPAVPELPEEAPGFKVF